MEESNSTEIISLFLCSLIDIPDSRTDCSILHPQTCIKCHLKGGYFSGESILDFQSVGHVVSLILWSITMLVGAFGIIGNLLVIRILKRRKSGRSFDYLLRVLAIFDIFCIIMAMLASTVLVLYFQGWIGKGAVFSYFAVISFNTMLLSRSTSIFTTVLITIMNYISIAFPLTSMQWFTARRTRLLALSSFFLSLCLAIPRYLSVYVGENHLKEEQFNVSRLNEFPNILKPTPFSKFFYRTLKGIHNQIDYWVPLPLLMIFILLSYWNVRKINKRRKDLNFNQKNEIQAVTMFLPVVIVLFVCNIGPIVHYCFMHFKGIIYREMIALVCLSAVLNSSLNFPIYYFRASNFRNEARSLLSQQSMPTLRAMSSLGE